MLNPELTEMVVSFLAPPLGFQPHELKPSEELDNYEEIASEAQDRFDAFIKPDPEEVDIEILFMLSFWGDCGPKPPKTSHVSPW